MDNKYSYGSVEYKLNEAKENIDKILQDIVETKAKLAADIGPAKPITTSNCMGQLKSSLEYYYPSSSYWGFNKDNEDHINTCYNKAVQHANELLEQSKTKHEENIQNLEYNLKIKTNLVNIMKLAGIPERYTTYEYKSNRSRSKAEVGHIAGYISDLNRTFITSDSYEGVINSYQNFIKRADEWKNTLLKNIEVKKQETEKQDLYIRKIAKAQTLAEKYNITEYKNNEELISQVNEIMRSEYIKENYPNGTALDIKCCDSCSTWVVGEHRCSCGNRRIDLTIEGDFFEGFNAYPEAY